MKSFSFFRPFAAYYLLIWAIIKMLARYVFRDFDHPDLVLTINNRYAHIKTFSEYLEGLSEDFISLLSSFGRIVSWIVASFGDKTKKYFT